MTDGKTHWLGCWKEHAECSVDEQWDLLTHELEFRVKLLGAIKDWCREGQYIGGSEIMRIEEQIINEYKD